MKKSIHLIFILLFLATVNINLILLVCHEKANPEGHPHETKPANPKGNPEGKQKKSPKGAQKGNQKLFRTYKCTRVSDLKQ